VIFDTIEGFAAALAPMQAVAGLDLGEKTIGVAVSDSLLTVASPLETIRRKKFGVDAARLLEIADARGLGGFVLGLPFREAHHITGTLVAAAEQQKIMLDKLSLEDMQAVESRITDDVYSVLSVENSVASRTSFGGTAPDNVRTQVQHWLKKLDRPAPKP